MNAHRQSATPAADTMALVADFARSLPSDPAPELPWRQNLAFYLERLSFYNRSFNLVGKQGPEDILADLAQDSFQLAALLEELPIGDAPLSLDCGAGAGLPGIPLRMIWQKGEYVLAETRSKRALFMQNVLASLKLPKTRVFHGDAGKFSSRPDIVISRAWLPPQAALDFANSALGENSFAIIFARVAPPPSHPAFLPALSREYDSPGGKRILWAMRHAGI